MNIQEFEIEFSRKSNNYLVDSEKVVKEVKPELEDLEVTPSAAEQKFKSEKYGYDNVTVKAVEAEEINIIPSIETQVKEGIFSKVTVEAIEDLTDEITEQDEIIINQDSTIENIIEVLNQKSGVNNKLQEKSVMPSTESQEIIPDEEYFGLSKVTVPGEENLVPENIKKGTSIFGVEGNASVADFKITDAYYLFYNGHRLENLQEILNLCGKITNATNMFYACINLTELDVSNLDTSELTNMTNMFYRCENLTELDLSNFDTSNVTKMDGMFNSCENLTELDLSNFDTSKVTTMSGMFSGCEKIKKLDVSSFDTSKVSVMANMFYDCKALTELDVSSFDTSNVTTANYAFSGCSALKNLDLSNFDMGKVTNIANFFGGLSILENLSSFYNLGKGYTSKTNNYNNYKLQKINLLRNRIFRRYLLHRVRQ